MVLIKFWANYSVLPNEMVGYDHITKLGLGRSKLKRVRGSSSFSVMVWNGLKASEVDIRKEKMRKETTETISDPQKIKQNRRLILGGTLHRSGSKIQWVRNVTASRREINHWWPQNDKSNTVEVTNKGNRQTGQIICIVCIFMNSQHTAEK